MSTIHKVWYTLVLSCACSFYINANVITFIGDTAKKGMQPSLSLSRYWAWTLWRRWTSSSGNYHSYIILH